MTNERAQEIEAAIRTYNWRFQVQLATVKDGPDLPIRYNVLIRSSDFTRTETEDIQKIIGSNAYKIEIEAFNRIQFRIY